MANSGYRRLPQLFDDRLNYNRRVFYKVHKFFRTHNLSVFVLNYAQYGFQGNGSFGA